MNLKDIRGRTAASIAASIEEAVHAGQLRPGQPLPTIRELAARLHVSPVTVSAAYRLLHVRGLAVGDGRRGTRLRPQPIAVPLGPTAAAPAGAELVDLSSGNPDPELLPPLEPALRAVDATPQAYGGPIEYRPLVTFAASEFEADGIDTPDVTITHGSLDAIERILREELRPGDRVAVEDPTLPALLDVITGCGLTPEPVPVDDDGPAPEGVERAVSQRARAVVITARAHNPTGAAVTPPRAAELRRVLGRRRDLLVIESDPAAPVAGVPLATLCGATSRWAAVRSVSKFLGPDLRLALVVGDRLTIGRLRGRLAIGPRWVSRLLQQLAHIMWSDPSNGRRLARAGEIYAQRRGALLTALAERGIAAHGRSGFHVWVPVRAETAAVQILAARGWAVAAGERFRLRSGPAVRITTSALSARAAVQLAADLEAAARSGAVPV